MVVTESASWAAGASVGWEVTSTVAGGMVMFGCTFLSPLPPSTPRSSSISATTNQMAEAAVIAQRMGLSKRCLRHSR